MNPGDGAFYGPKVGRGFPKRLLSLGLAGQGEEPDAVPVCTVCVPRRRLTFRSRMRSADTTNAPPSSSTSNCQYASISPSSGTSNSRLCSLKVESCTTSAAPQTILSFLACLKSYLISHTNLRTLLSNSAIMWRSFVLHVCARSRRQSSEISSCVTLMSCFVPLF